MKTRSRTLQLIAGTFLLAAIACTAHTGSRSSPSDVGRSPAKSTPANSIGSRTATWRIYHSSRWGYTVRYPGAWRSLANFGAPDSSKYFANQDVSAPLQMHSGGIWLTIDVQATKPSIPRPPAETIDAQRTIEVDGVRSTLYSLNPKNCRCDSMPSIYV